MGKAGPGRAWPRRPAPVGLRPPAPAAITAAEAKVAELAAARRTNREIARALFMSTRTVEARLTRVYRKLGIRSRTELAHRLARKDAYGIDEAFNVIRVDPSGADRFDAERQATDLAVSGGSGADKQPDDQSEQ